MLLLTYEEREFKWLLYCPLSVQELVCYLTAKNDNIMVYVKRIYTNYKNNKQVYEMSNGISCSKSEEGKWYIVS